MDHLNFMRRAVALSCTSVRSGGGPFGAVVVRDGAVVGEGTNRVVQEQDPTAHAEVVAIRAACRALATHVLSDAVIYTSCEPCPMCLGAIWWSRIRAVYYANTRADAARIGFDDDAIYQEVARPLAERILPLVRVGQVEAAEVFARWQSRPELTRY